MDVRLALHHCHRVTSAARRLDNVDHKEGFRHSDGGVLNPWFVPDTAQDNLLAHGAPRAL
jgi:hypothetical protein